MKYPALALGLLVCSATASAQQTAMVQMQCRDLASTGNSVNSDEVLINGMACHTANPTPPPARQVPSNQFASSDAPAAPEPARVIDNRNAQPVSGYGQIAPVARIVIAPMGGFETYFAAAMREKKVPATLTLDKDSAQFFVVSTETEWHGFVYGSGGSSSWSPMGGGSGAHAAAATSTRGLEASIMLIDAKSKDVVWAYEVHKNSHGGLLLGTHAARGQQSLAEACAKHLKEFIEKGK